MARLLAVGSAFLTRRWPPCTWSPRAASCTSRRAEPPPSRSRCCIRSPRHGGHSMAITGWIHPTRDLRDERPAVNAMTVALTAGVVRRSLVRLARRAAFAHLGLTGGYADWRHPERPDPDLAVAVDGQLTNRGHLDEQLYGRPRPLSGDAEVLLHAYRAWGAGL